MFGGTLSLTQENHHLICQIGKNKCSQGQNYQDHALPHITQLTITSNNTNILKFLLSPVRFTKCLGVLIPLRPPRKKALVIPVNGQCSLSRHMCVLYGTFGL
jgi:hypothetical protein